MTSPDVVRDAVEKAVAAAPAGETILAGVRLREQATARRSWPHVATAAAAVVVVAVGAVMLAPRDHTTAPPFASDDRRAVAEQVGVRVALEVADTKVQVGELVHARASVTNQGHAPVSFGGGSCQAPENQPNVEVDLRPGQPQGRTWSGPAAAFKARALTGAPYRFRLGRQEGETACLTYLRTWRLEAGQTFTVPDVVWRVATPLDSAYDGTGAVTATFRFMQPGNPESSRAVSARVSLTVSGGNSGTLAPAAAVDRALADPQFKTFVEQNPSSTWASTGQVAGVAVDPFYKNPKTDRLVTGPIWRVFLYRNENVRHGSIVLDPATGRVLLRDLPT